MGYSLIETPCIAIVTSNKNVTEFSSICYSSLVTHTSFLEWNCLQWNCEELAQGPCLIRRQKTAFTGRKLVLPVTPCAGCLAMLPMLLAQCSGTCAHLVVSSLSVGGLMTFLSVNVT